MKYVVLFILALVGLAQGLELGRTELVGIIRVDETIRWDKTHSYPLCFRQNKADLYYTNMTHMNLSFTYTDMRRPDCSDAYLFSATEETYIDYVSEDPGEMNMGWSDVKDIVTYGIKIFHLS